MDQPTRYAYDTHNRQTATNSLTGRDTLQADQHFSQPSLANTTYDRANSMWPYDASVHIGNTTPNLPRPDSGGCGFLEILLIGFVVVATGAMSLGAAAMTSGTMLGAASERSLVDEAKPRLTGRRNSHRSANCLPRHLVATANHLRTAALLNCLSFRLL
jgi:hypothetical protein